MNYIIIYEKIDQIMNIFVPKICQNCILVKSEFQRIKHDTIGIIIKKYQFSKDKDKNIKYPILRFENQQKWRDWLYNNHKLNNGVWLKIGKKGSLQESVSYSDAVDDALCFGWIDGQRKKFDKNYFIQKFTPRREKSIWSKKNIENVERLQKQGKITASGLAEIKRAKQDGRWEASYNSQATMVIPQDFVEAVKKNKKAHAFYSSLSRSSLFAICLQLQTAKKAETRQKRFEKLLEMLERQEKPK